MVFVLVIKIHSSFLNIKIHCINLINTSNMDRFRKKPRHIADGMLQFGTVLLHRLSQESGFTPIFVCEVLFSKPFKVYMIHLV